MCDFRISDHGSVIGITPLSDLARAWIDENVASEPWQWRGGVLCIEPRCARDLVAGIAAEGFEISP